MYERKIKIGRLKDKVRFVELRLAAFAKWDAPRRLEHRKQACMTALKNQLCFLKEFNANTTQSTLQLKEKNA